MYLGGKMMICNYVDYGEMALPSSWFDDGQIGKENQLKTALRRIAGEK